MLKIAIVGNIASGKSTVENILRQRGFKVFDTDEISHRIMEQYSLDILKLFINYDIGENGSISRKKLGNLVFKNEKLRKKLENFMYPKIKSEILSIFAEYSNENYVFISIPLLFEVGWQNLFDKILFIKTDDEIRLKRLMIRNSFTEVEARARINSQMPQDIKVEKSDFIICNNETEFELQKNVDLFIIHLKR